MPLDIPRIQAICFDIDGTLSDTDNQMIAQVERWLFPLRLFMNADMLPIIVRRLVMALESPANVIYEWLDRLNLDGLLTRIMDRFPGRGFRKKSGFLLIEGVMPMLESLSRRYPLAIVSARDERSSFAFLRQFKLLKYFKVVITSQSCPHTKPFAQPLLFAARRLGVAPENILMVGDTTVDIKTGKRAGSQTLGVLCGFGTERELILEQADLILPSTADLEDLFA
jgi:HAD superfamily hydrolase (TIGR01549 family)